MEKLRILSRRQTRAPMRIWPALGLIFSVLSALPALAQDAPSEKPPAMAEPDTSSEPGDAQRSVFGNLGLAAAAYNAGPRRIREWINDSGAMPLETRNYVLAITGIPVEQWSKAGPDADRKQEQGLGCGELMALLSRAPNRFVAALEQRIVAGVMQPWGAILGADMSRPRMLS